MLASVQMAIDEPLSGARIPIVDPESGDWIGWTGSRTLKPGWMKDPDKPGKYYSSKETEKAIGTLLRGKWPRTKRQIRIAETIEQALHLDADNEKARAIGVAELDQTPDTLPPFVTQEVARPRVVADRAAGTFTLGARSPYKGVIRMVNLPGHKRGCRCVGCSPETRKRGMAALRRMAKRRGQALRHNKKPSRPAGVSVSSRPTLQGVARVAGKEAGNRSMRKAGRKQWAQADHNAALREYHRVLGTDLAEGNPKRPNPRSRTVGAIPGMLTRIEYRRTGKHPGRYYHRFGRGVRAFALADGSIVLRGPRRLYVRQ
jgi:hypothetical protein